MHYRHALAAARARAAARAAVDQAVREAHPAPPIAAARRLGLDVAAPRRHRAAARSVPRPGMYRAPRRSPPPRAPRARAGSLRTRGTFSRRASLPGTSNCTAPCAPRPPPAPPRTKWTRRVPHPVLIGHLTPNPGPPGAPRVPRRHPGATPAPPRRAEPLRPRAPRLAPTRRGRRAGGGRRRRRRAGEPLYRRAAGRAGATSGCAWWSRASRSPPPRSAPSSPRCARPSSLCADWSEGAGAFVRPASGPERSRPN